MVSNAADSRVFLFAHLRTPSGDWITLSELLKVQFAQWPAAQVMGLFMGLFGTRNQDVFVLLSLPSSDDAAAGLATHLPAGVQVLDSLIMKATVRPVTDTPLTRPGIYVFRFFDVLAQDVAEITSLSQTAWHTFEADSAFSSEPMGLFRSADPTANQSRMLLLTWYDNFASWERSRAPHPDAAANFRRRRALVQSVIPYATRLVDTAPR